MPARCLKLTAPLLDSDARHHAVQRLPVEVDDPHDIAETLRGRVGDGLPDVALVQFGVAEQRDETRGWAGTEVRIDIPAGNGREERRRRAEAHRSGREVDRIGVLGARRIGLQPTERPQRREIGAVEIAEEVVDRVQHRRGVRLDGDAVRRVEVREVERCHGCYQAGTAGLVTADLYPIAGGAVVVRAVDNARGQPKDALRDVLEQLRIRLHASAFGHFMQRHRARSARTLSLLR